MRYSVLLCLLFSVAAQACPIAGPDNAPLVIEEYVDFECGHCVDGALLMKQALSEYPGQIKLVLRHMPMAFHSSATVAAKAFSAICLQDSKMAYGYQEELLSHQAEFKRRGEVFLYELAERLGADVARMKADMAAPVVGQILADDRQSAAARGLTGAPAFWIGTEAVVGAWPYAEIKTVIERQLNH